MNNTQSAWFSINLSTQTGSLERLLGRVRRRGFQIDSMTVHTSPLTGGYRLELRLLGERSFEGLARHLANQVDVSAVSLHVSQPAVEFVTSHFTSPKLQVETAAPN